MNATLQCLCQIEEFALYFKYDDHVNKVINNYSKEKRECLTSSFKILIEEIWPEKARREEPKQRNYSPTEFRKKIADMNPLFVNNQANDAKDLVNFIIMTLHEELNQSIVNNKINESTTYFNKNNDIEQIFKEFYEEYQRNFRSKISELFYAIQQTKTQCLNCTNSQYNFQAYFFLVFPLEEIRKYTINKINGNNFNFNNNNQLIMGNNMNMNIINNNLNNQIIPNNFNMIFNCMNINNNLQCSMNNNININNLGMNAFSDNNLNLGMNFGMNNMMGNFNQNQNNNMINNNGFLNINNNNPNFPVLVPQMQGQNNFINNNNNINENSNNNINQNQIQLNKLNNNIVNIFDCFEYNQKTEYFQGSNQIYCNSCHKMSNAVYNSYLTTAPKILILLLNRGVGIQFKIKLEFTTELDISKYILNKKENEIFRYKLIGVITHLGESGEGGHFIAHCSSPVDGEWYTYNDSIVKKIDDFQKQIIDLGMPYLLFYKLIDN